MKLFIEFSSIIYKLISELNYNKKFVKKKNNEKTIVIPDGLTYVEFILV
jgi:hypothetical protein